MTNGPSQEILLTHFLLILENQGRIFATALGTLDLDTYGMASPLLVPKTWSQQRRSLEYICTYGMLRRCKENHNIWCSVQNKEHTKGHLQNLKCAHQSLRYLKLSY